MSAHEKATPRPWRVTKRQPTIISNDGGDKWLARALIGPTKSPRFLHDSEQAEANATLIVEAVNSFEALTAERDALKAENEHIRERDIGLIQELIDALTELHEADDCINLARASRLDELRRDLDLMK